MTTPTASTPTKPKGLPIAAHLGLLVTLAVSAAFIAALAIVLLLPPRPPEVMRADQIVSGFTTGYQAALKGQTPSADGALRFRIDANPPHDANRRQGPIQRMLAASLDVPPDAIVISARLERRDGFVFRVQPQSKSVTIERDEQTGRVRVTTKGAGDGEESRSIEIDAKQLAEEGLRSLHMAQPGVAVAAAATKNTEVTTSVTQTIDVHGPLPPMPPMPPEAAQIAPPPIPPVPPMFAPAPPGVLLVSAFEVGAKLPDGRWLVMTQARTEEWDWIARTAGAFAATLLVFGLIAMLFASRIAHPIQGFARAVQGVGVDPHHAPVQERGPRELRSAAAAVNAMQSRLRTLIADRTQTLATVAHDMRTPLMRMRLAAETAPPETRERLAKEIADVEALVASFIAFARDDPAEEGRTRLDLAALLESLVDDQRATGAPMQYDGPERLIITGQPLGLKRVFGNLIDNARKYAGTARVTLRVEHGAAIVDVADDGPGVPAHVRDQIFKPFVRANAEQSGAGLGLAAARSIARAHGGDIVLAPTEKGALFRTTLPA